MKLRTVALTVILVIVLTFVGWYIIAKDNQPDLTPSSTHDPQYDTMLTHMFGTSYAQLTLTPPAVSTPP